ncbi:LON peptidase substrate-binding domain-containing protein [Candidatus Bealeia paramacronuclearis]|uniref:LON peptidase substrate-binding domain-containing protein n=1 Tax=Candidatus Bealeia paramacronuclearis TaxID=1921001 RepID=A0ABZ2C333_9PROT|nr:LON peptidase substrate-binding domain-containing protein [Candidatus Bealeia paramacronuclearis]
MRDIKLPEIVLLHPLAGTVLLPRAQTTLSFQTTQELEIFQKGLLSEGRYIGFVQPMAQKADQEMPLFRHGSLARITGFQESETGRIFVSFEGVSRFEILEKLSPVGGLHYARVCYEAYQGDLKEIHKDPFVDRLRLLSALKIYLQDQDMIMDWDDIEEISDEFLLNSLAQTCPFDNVEKQALLETKTLAERCEIMTTLIEMASLTGKGRMISYH